MLSKKYTIYLVIVDKIENKEQVMENKNKLNISKKDKIYINEDITKIEREKEKQIGKTVKE